MKKVLLGLIGTFIVGVLVASYTYYLNSEKADVRYTLSERIPTKFLNERTAESIQQLEVNNRGNAEAKNVRVLVTANIKSYEFLKYSKGDSAKEFKSKNSLEILYPTLPAQGNFKILLKSVGNGITKSDLDISHSKGKAQEVFATSMLSSIIINFVIIGWLFLIITSLIMFAIDFARDSLERDARWSPDEILRRKKPFYMSNVKWFSIRKDAIEKKVEKNYGSDIDKSAPYNILSLKDKPTYLNHEEWLLLINKAAESLSGEMATISLRGYSHESVHKLITLAKPANFPDQDWAELIAKIGKTYLLLLRIETNWSNLSSIVKAIKKTKPEVIPDHLWTEHIKYHKDQYYRLISLLLKAESNAVKALEKYDLDLLDTNDAVEIKKLAYSVELRKMPDVGNVDGAKRFIQLARPDWIADNDYDRLLSQAEKTMKLDSYDRHYEALLMLLESILDKRPLKEKPALISDQEWERLQDMDKQIRVLSSENSKKESELQKDVESSNQLKHKILRQLEIIDNMFKDPKSLDRIENYDNVFASGNWNNLRKIAKSLI